MKERNKMVQALKSGLSEVTFTKVNGDLRIMTCTLDNSIMPEDMRPKDDAPTKVPNPEVIAAYDVEADGWRSFRVENVTNFVSQ